MSKEKELEKFMKGMRKDLQVLSKSFIQLLEVLQDNDLVELSEPEEVEDGKLSKDIVEVKPTNKIPNERPPIEKRNSYLTW